MRRVVLVTLGACIAFMSAVAGAPGPGLFDPDVAFSATRTLEAQGEHIEQRYFQRSADHHRADTELKGQRSSMIMRRDRNVLWIVAPDRGTVLEMSLRDPEARSMRKRMVELPGPDRVTEYDHVGRESMHGVTADKYRVAAQDAQGQRVQGHLWVSHPHRIVVRMDLSSEGGRVVMELRDLVVGPQPDALFEPPANYKRLAFGGGVGTLLRRPGSPASGPSAGQPKKPGARPGLAEELAGEAVGEGLRKILGR